MMMMKLYAILTGKVTSGLQGTSKQDWTSKWLGISNQTKRLSAGDGCELVSTYDVPEGVVPDWVLSSQWDATEDDEDEDEVGEVAVMNEVVAGYSQAGYIWGGRDRDMIHRQEMEGWGHICRYVLVPLTAAVWGLRVPLAIVRVLQKLVEPNLKNFFLNVIKNYWYSLDSLLLFQTVFLFKESLFQVYAVLGISV